MPHDTHALLLTRRGLLTGAAAGLAATTVAAGPVHAAPISSTPVAGDYFVNPRTGDDGGSGHQDAPVRTLARAATLVASAAEQASGQTFTVWLSDGRHTLDRTLELSTLPNGCRANWLSLPGGRATISGARPLTGWNSTMAGGQPALVSTTLQENVAFRSLFVAGASRPRPTFPKVMTPVVRDHAPLVDLPRALPRFTDSTSDADDASAFSFEPGDMDPAWRNPQDIDVVSLAGYYDERCPVVELNRGVAQVKRMTPGDQDWRGRHYYADNVAEALSLPGEWYLDRPTGTVTYIPMAGESPDSLEFLVPHLSTLVTITGTLEEPATGHSFSQLDFAHADWSYAPLRRLADGTLWMGQQGGACVDAAVQVRNARDIDFLGCNFHALGGAALDIQQDCQRVRVDNCRFTDLGGGAIRVSSQRIGPGNESFGTGDVQITHCTVDHYGKVFHLSAGILVQGVRDALVQNNEVHHGFYTGISCGWSWSYADTGAHDNLLDANHVHTLGLGLMGDLGGIYTCGRQPGSKVSNNHVHDIAGYATPSTGIYLDQASSLIEVTDNLVHHNSEGIWAPNDSAGLVVTRNVVADNRRVQLRVGGGVTREGLGGLSDRSMTITGNIVAAPGGALIQAIDRAVYSDGNLLWDFTGTLVTVNGVSTIGVDIIEVASSLTLASANVPAVGAEGGCAFADLDKRVTLQPGEEYVVALQALDGGPSWHQPPWVTTTSVASVVTDTFEAQPQVYARAGSAGKCFGPVNFRYATDAGQQSYVTATSDLDKVSWRNNYDGHVGMIVRIGDAPIEVTALGAWPMMPHGTPLDAWRAQGHDTSSIVADPMFADHSKGSYTLQAGSPAASLPAGRTVNTAGVR